MEDWNFQHPTARRLPQQPVPTGPRSLGERILDGIGTAIVAALCVATIAFGLATMGFVKMPGGDQPTKPAKVTQSKCVQP